MRNLSSILRLGLLWCLTALLLPGCVEPYAPNAISSPRKYLVVDGFINPKGVTTISLSRTYDLAAKTAPPVEAGATLNIEDEQGTRYPLRESSVRGTYSSIGTLPLNPTRTYRLRIQTLGGKDYASAYVAVKLTPPIDNVIGRPGDAGLDICVNTHDDANASQYYRWDYEETWEIMSPYNPQVVYRNGTIELASNPYPRKCWGNAKSTDIKLTKTTQLSRDVVANYVLRSFPTTASQLFYGYSILVRQYAQTKEEYAYWELLKKNTENIGTLFDPLPSQLTGNVQCLNDNDELAIGYVGAHSVEQQRIFIRRTDLPSAWNVKTGYENCLPPDYVDLYPAVSNPPTPAEILKVAFSGPDYLPIERDLAADNKLIGVWAKPRDCIDCRTRGSAVKPSFWP